MRVGIISYDFYPPIGGQGTYTYELYQHLPSEGVTPIVFTSRNSKLKNTHYVPANDPVSFSILVNLELRQRIHKYKLDLIHLQGGPGGVFLLQRVDIPVIYTSHHTYAQQEG